MPMYINVITFQMEARKKDEQLKSEFHTSYLITCACMSIFICLVQQKPVGTWTWEILPLASFIALDMSLYINHISFPQSLSDVANVNPSYFIRLF